MPFSEVRASRSEYWQKIASSPYIYFVQKPESGVLKMPLIKQLDLLKEVEQRHPDGIIQGSRRKIITLIELGSKYFRTPEMVKLLKKYWEISKNDLLYIINLEGIDVLTPLAAKILVESAPDIASECKTPVLFTNVGEMVRESLESEACRFTPTKIIWILDKEGKAHLVGQVPNKFQELLDFLEKNGPASASQIAEILEGDTSKKTIGNLSVYLQKLFSAGLLGREKVTALEREKAARGWTYSYQTAPTIQRKVPSEFYMRKP